MSKIAQAKEFYLKRKFLYNLILLSLLFFIHCFWGNMMYLVYPFLLALVIFDNLQNAISYILYTLPFCFLNVYISVILYLVCVLIYIIKFYYIRFFKEKQKPQLVPLIVIAVFFVYCLMPTGPYNQNLLVRILILAAVMVAFCMVSKRPDLFRGHFNVKLVCYAIIVSSAFSLTYFVSPYLKSYLDVVPVNESLVRFMALFYHTNVLAMFCEVLLSFLAFLIISRQGKTVDYILFFAIAFIGFLTFSKTYLIMLTFISLVLVIWKLCTDTQRTLTVVIPLAVFGIGFYLIIPDVVNTFVNRFIGTINDCETFSDFMNMITTYRYDLWCEYVMYLFNNPLALIFGKGLGAPVLSTLSPHCAYISIIYELGIVGTLLFVASLVMIFKDYLKPKNRKKTHWAIFVPIVVLFSIFLVEDLLFYVFL